MWDKGQKLPHLCSKIAPASPGVSDKKSPAPGGLGASIPRPRPRSGGGGPGASGGLSPGVGNSIGLRSKVSRKSYHFTGRLLYENA